ncbi:MAG TPA: hypothetical protein VK576_00735, partial [Thermoleophilia bacterium]|nr:hypothetical protein [Thermoleophilia bacterium]
MATAGSGDGASPPLARAAGALGAGGAGIEADGATLACAEGGGTALDAGLGVRGLRPWSRSQPR